MKLHFQCVTAPGYRFPWENQARLGIRLSFPSLILSLHTHPVPEVSSHPRVPRGAEIRRQRHLRHHDDAEIQPVPRVAQEGEAVYTETARDDLHERFKRVNPGERVSAVRRSKRVVKVSV